MSALSKCILPPLFDFHRSDSDTDPVSFHRMVSTSVLALGPLSAGGCGIGRYAVCAAANRLLSKGATPRFVASTFTIDMDVLPSALRDVASDMEQWAVQAEMEWLECSSRVVSEGCPPGGVGISAFALGEIGVEPLPGADCIRPGDAVILSGSAGTHGAAVYAALKGLDSCGVSDDTAPLNDLVHALIREEYGLRLMCYPEKGVRAAAGSITAGTPWHVKIDEASVAVDPAVASFCSENNLDPLSLSTCGAMMAVVSERYEPAALAAIRRSAYGVNATVIGRIA